MILGWLDLAIFWSWIWVFFRFYVNATWVEDDAGRVTRITGSHFWLLFYIWFSDQGFLTTERHTVFSARFSHQNNEKITLVQIWTVDWGIWLTWMMRCFHTQTHTHTHKHTRIKSLHVVWRIFSHDRYQCDGHIVHNLTQWRLTVYKRVSAHIWVVSPSMIDCQVI